MEPVDIVKTAVEVINEGRIDDALAFYSESVVQRSPDPDSAGFKVRHGKEALRRVLESDIHGETKAVFHYDRLIAGESVVAAQGTNCGYFDGVYVEQPVALFFDIEDSRIEAVTIYYDRLAIRRVVEQSPRGTGPGAAADAVNPRRSRETFGD